MNFHDKKQPGSYDSNRLPSTGRRSFLKRAAAATIALAGKDLVNLSSSDHLPDFEPQTQIPWYRRITRWGQTNISEKDPAHYDIDWWIKHWRNTATQGVIVNAGGIVAYYPSRVPLHRQAQFLEGRDLFGDLCRAAHGEGLAVFARMDSNRAHEEFYKTHPDWFAIDSSGNPYKAGDLFITCVNSPYYNEHIPSILTEVSNLYHPEGFTDNSWSGLGRNSICYCENCKKSFRDKTGEQLPERKDWDNPVYRKWIRWNYDRRLEIWDLNNRTSRAAGGRDCIWSGMNSGSVSGQSGSFRDYKEICSRADIIMLDSQARSDAGGFQQNADVGKFIHGMLGWDKLIPESMAQYQAGRPTFRLAAKPEPEARMWMIEGMAGGIQPWWHYVGAAHDDRRIYHTAVPVFNWHKKNEEFLINRRPVATVGVVWSQQNTDFFGRDDAELMVDLPYRGITQSLIRARIPYIPVHADHIDREAPGLGLLILPNMGVMTGSQVASVKKFVAGGGGLIATGESSLYDENGDVLSDYALAGLFGAHAAENRTGSSNAESRRRYGQTYHTYMRLTPELRKNADGPVTGLEPEATGTRHPVLKGFDETDIISFGGQLDKIRTEKTSDVLLTFIPEFPIYPPETAWMREPKTDIPGLIVNSVPGGGRVAFLPADLDRQYGRYNLPDHGNLLANIIRWTAKENIPLTVEGSGLIDCNMYRQKGRLVLHIVNLTSAGTWRQPVDEFIQIGPLKITLKLPDDVQGRQVRLLVSESEASASVKNRLCEFTLRSVRDHEVAVIA